VPILRSARRLAGRAVLRALALLPLAAPPALAPPALAQSPTRPAAEARVDAPGVPAAARERVQADTIWSAALRTRKQFLVYLPASYAREPARRYPVAYYLHGLWGDETNWVRSGRLDAAMDSLVAAGGPEMIVVMPDGDDSWYTTWNTLGTTDACMRDTVRKEPAASYCVPWTHYDDYVARDLVAKVDSTYRTRADRRHRGIAGLSMGGYGALSLALRYPDVYSAAASHSGVVAPLLVNASPFTAASPPQWAANVDTLAKRWRNYWTTIPFAFGKDTAGWWARDPGRLAARLQRRDAALLPALFLDVGVDDLTRDQNRALHATLDGLRIAHTYAEWPGAHDWRYWRAHVPESLAWLGARIAASPP
jgi:S-formylglutathione hydrolase FrmB